MLQTEAQSQRVVEALLTRTDATSEARQGILAWEVARHSKKVDLAVVASAVVLATLEVDLVGEHPAWHQAVSMQQVARKIDGQLTH